MASFKSGALTDPTGLGIGLFNDSPNAGDAVGAPQGIVMAGDAPFCVQMIATAAVNPGDALVQDFATGAWQVTKTAANDSTARFGIAVTAGALGKTVWVCVLGTCQAISGAAIAAGAAIATSANAAGQVKTAAGAGGRTNLGWAIGAPGGAGVNFTVFVDKS